MACNIFSYFSCRLLSGVIITIRVNIMCVSNNFLWCSSKHLFAWNKLRKNVHISQAHKTFYLTRTSHIPQDLLVWFFSLRRWFYLCLAFDTPKTKANYMYESVLYVDLMCARDPITDMAFSNLCADFQWRLDAKLLVASKVPKEDFMINKLHNGIQQLTGYHIRWWYLKLSD